MTEPYCCIPSRNVCHLVLESLEEFYHILVYWYLGHVSQQKIITMFVSRPVHAPYVILPCSALIGQAFWSRLFLETMVTGWITQLLKAVYIAF